jgi:hypothetical protein
MRHQAAEAQADLGRIAFRGCTTRCAGREQGLGAMRAPRLKGCYCDGDKLPRWPLGARARPQLIWIEMTTVRGKTVYTHRHPGVPAFKGNGPASLFNRLPRTHDGPQILTLDYLLLG